MSMPTKPVTLWRSNALRILIATALLSTQAACTLQPVKPWDRGILSRAEMQPDANALFDGFDEHIYFSKEATTGGAGLGGGGCGCN